MTLRYAGDTGMLPDGTESKATRHNPRRAWALRLALVLAALISAPGAEAFAQSTPKTGTDASAPRAKANASASNGAKTKKPAAKPQNKRDGAAARDSETKASTATTTSNGKSAKASAGKVEVQEGTNRLAGGLRLLLVAAVFIVPVVLGNYIGKAARMPDHAWRISVALFAVLVGSVVTIFGWPPKLGIDLRGGAILIYQVTQDEFDMNGLVAAVTKRVNPGGIKEVTVRPYGEREVEIVVPEADQNELARIKEIIRTTGKLEFRIVANERDHGSIIKLAQQPRFKNLKQIERPGPGGKPETIALWVPLVQEEVDRLDSTSRYTLRENKKGELEALVVTDPFNVTGKYVTSARPGSDQYGKPAVNFTFDAEGARRFGTLTARNLPDQVQNFERQLAIILDDYLQSAPSIQGRIDERGEITGNFTREKVEALASVFTAGSLPATLDPTPTSSLLTGPTLGQDTIDKGVKAMFISTITVVVFMLIYYRFAGLVANLALVLNVLLIVAFMILFNGAFTLSGLAGLALTVGMAVDANVLIYERMREEMARGATFRMAIRNGFDRATVTIIDANVTTLISGVVLYAIGTEQVKGFAVTLILGLVMNLFTAITVSRLVFDMAEKLGWVRQLKMLRILEKPNFDFIGKRRIAYAFSAIVLGGGMFAVFERGSGLLDIDFTGGSSVETLFEQPQDISFVRQQVQSLPDVTVQDVRFLGEPAGKRFLIVTSEPDIETVEQRLKKFFAGGGNQLAFNHVSWDPVRAPRKEKAPAKKSKPRNQKAAGDDDNDSNDPLAKASTTVLTFSQPIDHSTLTNHLERLLTNTPDGDVPFEVDNREYEEGSRRTFTQWTAKVALNPRQTERVFDQLRSQLRNEPFFPSSNKVGASVAGNTQLQATYAMLASLALILIYVWIRFQQVSFGFACILAVIHDVLAALGALAVSLWIADWTIFEFLMVEPFKISLPVIAAFLTIIGYSLNDTIVIFDRIREVRGKSPDMSPELVNLCINQTLSRTILTSLTVFMVVLILYIMGGAAIHGFAFALVIGTISGTYSTVYIATPVVIWLNRRSARKSGNKPSIQRPIGAAMTAGKPAR